MYCYKNKIHCPILRHIGNNIIELLSRVETQLCFASKDKIFVFYVPERQISIK